MEHPENNEAYKGLVVNAGIEQPSSVNPYLKRKVKKRQLSVSEFVEGIVKGDVTILSQAVTLVESVRPEHQATAQEVIEKCLPYSGNSIRVVNAAKEVFWVIKPVWSSFQCILNHLYVPALPPVLWGE